jgi:FKBP-type peptidyl-prolyl cis-trans isomerase
MPDSGSSQFFISVVDNDFLDQPQRDGAAYAVFGKVIEGMDVVDRIKGLEVGPHPEIPGGKVPTDPVVIKSAKLVSAFDRTKAEAAVKQAEEKAAAARAAAEEAKKQAKAEREKAMREHVAKLETETGKKAVYTDSGMAYLVLEEGDGPSPEPAQTVKVHYAGWLLDGTQFDSSYDRGQPATFPLNRVIAGWTEGVGLMKVGAKHKLVIPAELAYGAAGRPGIPPNATLVFDVELLEIVSP